NGARAAVIAGTTAQKSRHAQSCHRKSGLPDLRHSMLRNSGKPEFRWHPRRADGTHAAGVAGRTRAKCAILLSETRKVPSATSGLSAIQVCPKDRPVSRLVNAGQLDDARAD